MTFLSQWIGASTDRDNSEELSIISRREAVRHRRGGSPSRVSPTVDLPAAISALSRNPKPKKE